MQGGGWAFESPRLHSIRAVRGRAAVLPTTTVWGVDLLAVWLGKLTLLALRLIGALVYRGQEAVASGDVTIGALVGATTGLQVVVPALLGGIILGGVLALVTAATRRSLSGTMAYGPGLCLGAFLALLAPR